MTRRLAILSTHPIQYNAPFFRHLSRLPGLVTKVFYGWEGTANQIDPEFGRAVTWDVPLLSGYDWQILPNRARDPGTHHFSGIDNPGMAAAIADWRPDAILVYGWAWKTHLAVMRRFKGRVPILFRGDSILATGAHGIRGWLRSPALRWIYRHVDLALYPGERNLEYLRAHGLSDGRAIWMPHAVDNAFFAADAARREAEALALRRQLQIPETAPVFLFAGKLVPRKRPELLLRSFLSARWPGAEPHLVVVGTGPQEAELKAQAGGCPRIHFLGFRNQSEMPAIYRLGDVVVLPSDRDTWGLAVNEAMACGRTVLVSSAIGCATDLAADPQVGRVFPAGDGAALGAEMAQLAADKARLADMGRAAAAFIGGWSVERAASELEKAIERAVSDRHKY